jgi:hypothetical protein
MFAKHAAVACMTPSALGMISRRIIILALFVFNLLGSFPRSVLKSTGYLDMVIAHGSIVILVKHGHILNGHGTSRRALSWGALPPNEIFRTSRSSWRSNRPKLTILASKPPNLSRFFPKVASSAKV